MTRAIAASLAILGATAGTAPADQPVEGGPAWVLDLLDSPDWAVRQGATEMLREDETIGLDEIEGLIADPSLSPEARLRLEGVARERFMTSSRAAVGMSWARASDERFGVVVASLTSGFEARDVLRVGDRIIEAQGRAVRDWERFRALILSNDPGDVFDLVVVRDGVAEEVSFELGDYDSLGNPSTLDSSLLEEAWDVRASAYPGRADALADAVDTGYVAGQEWNLVKAEIQSQWRQSGRLPAGVRTTLGSRRASAELGDLGPRVAAAGHQAAFDWGQVVRVRLPDEVRGEDMIPTKRELEAYRRAREVQLALLADLRGRLTDQDLDEETRQALTERVQRSAAGVENLTRWIEQVEAQGPGG